jgi:hypothetical protein
MNMLRYFIVITLLALLPATSQAKWWIFGQSENEISTKYLYLNGVSYDELGDKVTVYRETLENGQIMLRGKAATSSSSVGSVQVSSNNKESWEKARKSSDGSFEYSFRPEAGKSYVLYVKIIDTTGKSNDVDATRKEISLSDQNIAALVRQAVNEMIAAYRAEDPTRFMAMVSEDFAADPSVLDRAIRQDFSAFDNIDITYTINNVTAATGKIYASFSFSRKLTSSRSGQTLRDMGASEFIFALGEKGPLVFSMKNPLLFGLSDASEVATGTVNSTENSAVIQISSSGTVLVASVDSIANGDSDLVTGSFTLTNSNDFSGNADGFNFTQDIKTTLVAASQIYKESNLLWGEGGTALLSLGSSFSNITIPGSGWGQNVHFTTEGAVFAVKLPNNTYALIKYIGEQGAGNNVFEYKYQPNGSRSF